MNMPLVSVACQTYNHENYIAKAIEGFLLQKTSFPIEIIIHDDASTDDTTKIVKEYAGKSPKLITPLLQKENQYSQGIKPMINHVLPKCRGKYIAFCEGDDYWTDPYKLQTQVDYLEHHPELAMCFTNSSIVDENNTIINVSRLNDDRKKILSQVDVLSGLVPPPNTVMMRNIIKKDLQQFPNIVNGDILLFALITEHGDAGYIDEVTACYRIHDKGFWSSKPKLYQMTNYLKTYLVLLGLFKHKHEDILLRAVSNGYTNLLECYKNEELVS